MTELEIILQALREALDGGEAYQVTQTYPNGGRPPLTGPVVAVGLKAGSEVSCGFASYMGTLTTPQDGEREIYGKKMELTVGADIYSPRDPDNGAGKCLEVFSRLAGAVAGLPEGLHCLELTCGETVYDRTVEAFHCPCELKLQAYLYAAADDESGRILHFNLKGEIQSWQ